MSIVLVINTSSSVFSYKVNVKIEVDMLCGFEVFTKTLPFFKIVC